MVVAVGIMEWVKEGMALRGVRTTRVGLWVAVGFGTNLTRVGEGLGLAGINVEVDLGKGLGSGIRVAQVRSGEADWWIQGQGTGVSVGV